MRLEISDNPSRHNTTHESRSSPLAGPGSNASTSRKASSSAFTNGSSVKADSNGYSNGDAVPRRPPGLFFGHDREQVARILIQGLTDMGYHGAASSLSRESGYELENTSVAAFRNAVQNGEWLEAEELLFGHSRMDDDMGGVVIAGNGESRSPVDWLKKSSLAISHGPGLPLAEGASKHEMLFLMRQQKYLEMLEQRDLGSALMVLRQELTPHHQDTKRLHDLSSLIMCQSSEELRVQARWDGAEGESRNNLLSELSKHIAPSVMIPEHRLAVLFDQVQQNQTNRCLYHNTVTPPSLYHDHICEQADFPLQPLIELRDHTDEVWYIQYSNDGSLLATASSDNSIIVYSTTRYAPILRLSNHHGVGDVMGVCYVAWSPDDRYLLSCSRGDDLIVYDVKNGGDKVLCIDHFEYTVTSAVWLPDGSTFIVGSHDSKRPLEMYTLGSTDPTYSWASEDHSLRVNDCSLSEDGSRLAVVTNDQRLITYDLGTKLQIGEWNMDDKVTCVNMSKDGRTVLVSMNKSHLCLLCATTGEVLQRYVGLKQNQFVIRSAFGGAGESFVISGSEDSTVYIWRRPTSEQVATIKAHAPGSVNCVAWHPKDPVVFASAGDDQRVRIWSNQETVRRFQQRGYSRNLSDDNGSRRSGLTT